MRCWFELFVVVVVASNLCSCESINLCGSPGWTVPSPPDGLTLKQVTAVIRHGDRTVWNGSQCWPEDNSVWSCDLSQSELPMYWPSQYEGQAVPRLFEKVYLPSNEVMHGNCSVAQLTSKGYTQHLANGRSLNKAYVKSGFLKETLDPTEIYLRSDDVPRTLQSAQALVMGMYPVASSRLREGNATPLIPLHTRDTTYDSMAPNPLLCPKVGLYGEQFRESKTWKDHAPSTQKLFDKIKNTTGIEINEDSFAHFSDCLCTHYCHNLSMPKGMTDELLEEVWAENSWQFYSMYNYPSMKEFMRVSIGFLLKDIWKSLNDSVHGSSSVQKFLLLSGHDTTIMPLLVALGVADGNWAPYASMILIELYQTKDKKFVVRIIYNGKVVSPPFCDKGICDYQKLSGYLATVTPPDNYRDDLCKV